MNKPKITLYDNLDDIDLTDEIEFYENKIRQSGIMSNPVFEIAVFNLDQFKDQMLAEAIKKYIVFSDAEGYKINFSGMFYYKKEDSYMGYNTIGGKLKSYQDKDKNKLKKLLMDGE